MSFNPGEAIILYYCFLPNMKFKIVSKLIKMLFLVWIRRKGKRKILKLYKVRFSDT